jgi:tetratricopeptide (TPR) repeat protein
MNDKHAAHWDAVDEAVELLREHDRDGALAELGAALDKDPSNPYAHHFKGVVHYEREEWDDARKAYEQALKYAPEYLGSIVGRGHALRQLGRFDEAIRMGERALEVSNERQDADAHFLLALTYAAKGENRRAIVHVEEFLRSNPEVEARYEAEALLQTLQGKAKPLEPV